MKDLKGNWKKSWKENKDWMIGDLIGGLVSKGNCQYLNLEIVVVCYYRSLESESWREKRVNDEDFVHDLVIEDDWRENKD